jgi:hypothetical protein
LLWDFVMVLAVGGIAFGVFDYAQSMGWPKALVMGTIMLAAGWLGGAVIYPLWFGHE